MGWLANTVENIGTAFNAPELNISEWLNGGATPLTGSTPLMRQQEQQIQSTPQNWGTPTGTQTNNTGNVLGTNTSLPSGGAYVPPGAGTNGGTDPNQSMMNGINQGWDQYTNSLNSMLTDTLPGQKSAQEGIANTSYNQNVNTLGTQRDQSTQAVNQSQVKNLKDLGENVQNLFQAGNVNLGSRGAGDSSAANQYAYAISKMGTKARGDIMTQATQRIQQIGDVYNSETNRLKSELDTRINQIADWFNNAKSTVMQQIGSAGVNKAKDVQALAMNMYNQALQATQTIQQEYANNRQILETWAANNSTNAQQLTQNMQTIQQMPAFQGLQNGMPSVSSQGNYQLPVGAGSNNTQEKDMWGNIIKR